VNREVRIHDGLARGITSVLKQEQDGYEFCQKQMAECDRRLEQYLQQREDRSQGACLPAEKRKDRLKKKKGNTPPFGLRADLFRMTGTDLAQIDGIDVMTATTIRSEAGWDMSKWKTVDHFVFLATTVSGQSNRRRQDHRDPARESWRCSGFVLLKVAGAIRRDYFRIAVIREQSAAEQRAEHQNTKSQFKQHGGKNYALIL
jgi:hypothetical protein